MSVPLEFIGFLSRCTQAPLVSAASQTSMDSYVKLASLSQGRDKIFRTTQYACILLNCLIHKHGSNKELAAKLKHLESNLSSGRKCKYKTVLGWDKSSAPYSVLLQLFIVMFTKADYCVPPQYFGVISKHSLIQGEWINL